MKPTINKVLLLGGGPSNIGHENELDAASFERLMALKKMGKQVIYIDDNPYSITSEELQPASVYVLPVTYKNVVDVISKEKPDAIMITTSGLNGIQIGWQLLENGVLDDNNMQLLGLKASSLKKVIDNGQLRTLLTQINERVIASKIVANEEEAFEFVRDNSFPVIVKPISSNLDTNRFICNNTEELESALEYSFKNNLINLCLIEQSIVGYKEIELVGIRDRQGNKVLVSGLENMDPIGIHSGDSIIFAPTQTLLDDEFQSLRTATFKIMDALSIAGTCHIQFALNPQTKSYYVTKVRPFFTQNTALAIKASGYPAEYIAGFLELGCLLTEVRLPSQYHNHQYLPIMEPTLDHVVVKIPLWPFRDVQDVDQHLNTLMKSIGATVGIGRTVEEALIKAMHSSQFSPRDILPSVSNLDEDELINQLIHPLASRILILMEALRRGFSISELSELTKIDEFYFYKLNQLLKVQKYVVDYPLTLKSVELGHRYGFGDGMLAELWNVDISTIKQMQGQSKITYKEVEPSAGEFCNTTNAYYASYEIENESQPFENKRVLVIGRGGNQLGPNTASDYYTTQLLIQLHRSGFKTIIMNTNPNAVSLVPRVSDKQYIEPIQLGNILNIIELEQPEMVFLPGNRHYLAKELAKFANIKVVVLPPDQKVAVHSGDSATVGIDLFIDQKGIIPITSTSFVFEEQSTKKIKNIVNLQQPMDNWRNKEKLLFQKAIAAVSGSNWHGLVQVLFDDGDGKFTVTGIRPVRITETALLNKTTGINWIAVLVKQYLGTLDYHKLQQLVQPISKHQRMAYLNAKFPFKKLQSDHLTGNSSQEIGATISFKKL